MRWQTRTFTSFHGKRKSPYQDNTRNNAIDVVCSTLGCKGGAVASFCRRARKYNNVCGNVPVRLTLPGQACPGPHPRDP